MNSSAVQESFQKISSGNIRPKSNFLHKTDLDIIKPTFSIQNPNRSNFNPKLEKNGFSQINVRRNRNISKFSKISYGILMFDQDGNFLALENPVSYALSSFLHILCGTEFLDYESLIEEFTSEEIQLLKDCWYPDGLNKLIEKYLELSFNTSNSDDSSKCEIRELIEKKFKMNRCSMINRWSCFLQIIDPDKLPEKTYPKILNFPKTHSQDKKKWSAVRDNFSKSVGLNLPSETLFGKWIPISYYSINYVQYNIELLTVKCSHIDIPDNSKARWISLQDLKSNRVYFAPEITEAIIQAWNYWQS